MFSLQPKDRHCIDALQGGGKEAQRGPGDSEAAAGGRMEEKRSFENSGGLMTKLLLNTLDTETRLSSMIGVILRFMLVSISETIITAELHFASLQQLLNQHQNQQQQFKQHQNGDELRKYAPIAPRPMVGNQVQHTR